MRENTNNWNTTTITVFKVFLFLAVASQLCNSIYHSHFFEYLYRGHWILDHLKFPKVYFLSSSAAWYDPNWLFEILISLIETNFSNKGLITLKILLLTLSLYASSRLFKIICKDGFFAIVLSVFAISGFFVSSDLSPQYLSLPLVCFLISELVLGNKNYFYYFILSYFLYNTQAISFIFVIATALFLSKDKKLLLLCTIALFLPPYYGLNFITNFKHFISAFSHSILLQNSPASIYDFRFAFMILSWVFAVVVSVGSKNLSNGLTKRLIIFASLFNLIALGFNLILPVALFINCIVISYLWSDSSSEIKHALTLLELNLKKISPIGIIWVLIAISFVGIRPNIKHPVSKALLPSKVVDIAVHRGLKLPLYHDLFSGSYLMYKLSKSSKGVVLNTFQSKDLKASRVDFLSKSLHPYFIKYFDFLAPKSVICRVSDPLYSLLKRDSDWTHINNEKDSNFSWALFEKN